MTDKFSILLTCPPCQHCKTNLGNIILNNGKPFMKPKFLMKIIAPKKRIRLVFIIINYYSMAGDRIKDISKIYYIDNRDCIVQEKYIEEENKTVSLEFRTYNITRKYDELVFKTEVMKNGNKITWLDFINDKISPKLENYIYYFPAFGVIDIKSWKDSIDDTRKQLLVYLNMGYTIETIKGEIMLDKTTKTLNLRDENILQMIDKYVVKKFEMKPYEI